MESGPKIEPKKIVDETTALLKKIRSTPAKIEIVGSGGKGYHSSKEEMERQRELAQIKIKEGENLDKLKTLKVKIKDLNEKYTFEMEKEAKANLWNQLEKAKKEYRALEEELDSQSKKIEKIKEAIKKEESAPVTPAIQTYPTAPEKPNPENINMPPAKKKFIAGFVDISDVAKSKARDAADAAMTMQAPKNPDDFKGVKKFFKGEFWKRSAAKIWKHGLWRDYYRNKAAGQARENIIGNQNIFAAEGRGKDSHDKFVKDVMEQFTSEYEDTIHRDAGEMRLRNEEIANSLLIKEKVKKLIIEYATGKMSREALEEEEKRIFSGLKADTEGKQTQKKEDVMHASNLVAIAEQVRKAMEVGEFLEGEDFDIDLIYGKSRGDVRTEAKLTRAEALAEKLSHTRLGSLVNETTLAASLSLATAGIMKLTQTGASFAAKIIPLIGTAAVTSLFAKVKEGKNVENERRQHAREMARGEKFDPARMERRREMEESRYGTQSAQEIINNLTQSNAALIENAATLTPEVLTQTTAALAAIEARVRLSDRRNIDLVGYSDTTKVVEERKNLDIEKAKMKVALRKLFEAGKFAAPNGQDFQTYFNSLATTQESALVSNEDTGIDAKDRIFNKMKSKRSWDAAKTAFVTGLFVGAAVQEIGAAFSDSTGIIEDALGKNVNLLNLGSAPVVINAGVGDHLTGLAQLRHYMSDAWNGTPPPITGAGIATTPVALHEAFPGSHIKLPVGSDMVRNPDGSYNLVTGDKVVAENLSLNPKGMLSHESQNILRASGVNMNTHMIGGQVQHTVGVNEYIKNHPGATHPMHRSWYSNDTEMRPDPNHPGHRLGADHNELRTTWGGEHGTGIDAKGNYVLDVSHMKSGGAPDGSWQKGLGSADAQELMRTGHLRMLISLSTESQQHVFPVDITPEGKIIVDAHSEIGKLAFENVKGHANFIGRFAEIGQDMGNHHYRMLSSLEGKGIKDIIDTVPTATREVILAMPAAAIDNVGNYSLPAFIPLVGRTPLEKMSMIEAAPYYMYYNGEASADRLAEFEKRRSVTLKENPQAKLDQFKEIETYLKKLDPVYYERVKDLAEQTSKMEAGCKMSIGIPVAGHQEGKQIYESLKNYTYQTTKRENFELVLFVNHPETDRDGKKLDAKETLDEIKRFKQDHPEIKLRVMYQTLPNEEAKIGKIRKLLADATLIRQHERGENASDLIMLSNDADNKGIDPRYVQTFINKFEGDLKVDGLLGQLDWDPESYQKYPAIHIGTRLFQYLNVIGRRRSNRMSSSGANSAFRSSMYAGIGGYMENLPGGEDIAIGQAIIAARANNLSSFGFAGTGTRLFTSSRRSIDALHSGLSPVEQWNKGFSAFDDEIRKLTMTEETIDYGDKETLKKLQASIEYIVNRTLDVWEEGENLGKGSPYYRKALGWMGIKYSLDKKGNIVITDMKSLVKGLKKYQEEGKLMRDARSGKSVAAEELKSIREKRKVTTTEQQSALAQAETTIPNQTPETATERKDSLESVVERFIDEIPTYEAKIGHLNKIISKGIDDKFLQKLGLNLKVKDIKKDLKAAGKIESGKEFIERVRAILRPISKALDENPTESANFRRKLFVEYHNFTPINDIFSYRIDGGELHLHLSPADDLSQREKIKLVREALPKLAGVIAVHRGVKEISATSPLVTTHPKLLEKVGFKIEGPISKEQQEEYFGPETETASKATMSRQEFTAQYKSNAKLILKYMLSWVQQLGKKGMNILN